MVNFSFRGVHLSSKFYILSLHVIKTLIDKHMAECKIRISYLIICSDTARRLEAFVLGLCDSFFLKKKKQKPHLDTQSGLHEFVYSLIHVFSLTPRVIRMLVAVNFAVADRSVARKSIIRNFYLGKSFMNHLK